MLSLCFTPDCLYSNAASSFLCLLCHYTQMQHEALSSAYYIPNYWTKSIYQHDTELHPGFRILPVLLVLQSTLSLQSLRTYRNKHSGTVVQSTDCGARPPGSRVTLPLAVWSWACWLICLYLSFL